MGVELFAISDACDAVAVIISNRIQVFYMNVTHHI